MLSSWASGESVTVHCRLVEKSRRRGESAEPCESMYELIDLLSGGDGSVRVKTKIEGGNGEQSRWVGKGLVCFGDSTI